MMIIGESIRLFFETEPRDNKVLGRFIDHEYKRETKAYRKHLSKVRESDSN